MTELSLPIQSLVPGEQLLFFVKKARLTSLLPIYNPQIAETLQFNYTCGMEIEHYWECLFPLLLAISAKCRKKCELEDQGLRISEHRGETIPFEGKCPNCGAT